MTGTLRPQPTPQATRLGGPAAWAAVLLVLLLAFTIIRSPARADGPPAGAVPYDHGVWVTPAPDAPDAPDDLIEAQFIRFFTDCDGSSSGSCGGAPGRWAAKSIPVTFCTFDVNRPSGIAARQFQDAVTAAADMWNGVEVGVGIRFTGDCTSGVRWENNNGRNELGFDDSRFVLTGSTAGVARGSWENVPPFGPIIDRAFTEFDVVFGRNLSVTDKCLRSIVAHELGHTLGLGHSDDLNDLMYATYNPSDPNSCRGTASASERARLAELYGVNRAPTVTLSGPSSAFAGTFVTLTAKATDPEGDPISYQWLQIAGPTVSLTTNGSTATLIAPDSVGSTLRFRVTTSDKYLHQSSSEFPLAIDSASAPPRLAPTLASFLPGASGSVLTWEPVANAANYRFCAGTECSIVTTPSAPVTWDVVLGAAGSPDARRVVTTGARSTSLEACNSIGCSTPGAGPLAGGVVWPAWGIDFGYLAWAYDVPAAGIRFTIGGVVNQSGSARKFTLYSGSAVKPLDRIVQNCGRVAAGGLCIGLLTPQQGGHGAVLTIVSELAGTPTIEQRVTIR